MRSIFGRLALLLLLAGAVCPYAWAQQGASAIQPTPAGQPRPGYLGIDIRDLTGEEATKQGLGAPTGVWVTKPVPGAPAAAAGLLPDDVILTVDGAPVAGSEAFRAAVGAKGAGALVELRLLRAGQVLTLAVTLAERPAHLATASPEEGQQSREFLRLIEQWEKTDDPEAKISAIEAALQIEPLLRVWPLQVARADFLGSLLSQLGNSYHNRRQGARADNLEAAIKAYEAALTNLTRETPEAWAETQNNLASAYRLRIRGSRADNLERAIEAFEAALTVRTREAAPEEWAETQTNLANAYEERIRGSKADNLEAAIKAFEAALTVRTRAAFPEEWAETQNDLALTYTNRIRGSKADNLEAAIKALEAALTVLTRAAFPEKWAGAQNNLALAYDQRILGSRADNLEEAIRAYESALTVRTREAFPQQWAVTQINLSNTYRVRIRGSRADNLEEAIRASELALTVQTREDFPQLWAMAQSNRAIAYLVRIRGSQAQNLELAIKALEAALTVRTREAYPDDWATTQQNLAIAYRNRIFGTRADNLEAAIKAFEAALTVRTREAFPREHLLIGRELGQSLLDKGHWREASAVYASARAAFLLLFGQGLEETNAQDLIEKAGPIFAEAAYAAAQGGDVNVALALLTEGKGRLMAVALRQQSLDLPADERARLIALQVEIRELRPVAERVKGEEGAKALERLIALRRVLGELLAAATSSGGGDALAAARGLVPAGGALVAPIVTKAGTKLLLVRSAMDGGSVTAINLPTLTTTRLAEVMRGPADNEQVTGWLGAFNIQYLPKAERDARWLEWPATIEGISWELWRLFGGALHTALADAGVKPGARLIWMPAGALGLLPIGLAQATPDQPRLGDLYEIVTAPSLESMLAAQRQVATPASLSLALVVNPTDDLPFTEVEGQLIAGHFPGSARVKLDKSTAEPPLVLTALQGKRYWHFSSHGTFDWADARRSGLLMKDKQPLTVQALLDAQDRLGRPRLVVLSACETGLYDIDRNPEEFVGLPATFMQLGAGGVLGTLWQVDDRATALLIARFYELHLGQGLAPPTALKQAQAWLRTSSKAELIAYAKAAGAKAGFTPDRLAALEASLKRRNLDGDARFAASWKLVQDKAEAALKAVGRAWTDDESLKSRPFEHPYYWGAFVYTGL